MGSPPARWESEPVDPIRVDWLACPACRGALRASLPPGDRLACVSCAAVYDARGGIAALRPAADARTEAVVAFYAAAPFPNYPAHDSLANLRARAAASEFAGLLDRAIGPDACVLDLGCGTGQMSLFLASANRVVVGADATRASLELAASAAHRYGVRGVHFVETDLRAPGLRAAAFDVVYSSGVLHHTPDPRASFHALVDLVKPGGFVVLGLYNAYARWPHRLRRAVARMTKWRIIPFDPVLRAREGEPERRRAWFRDQYEHPEEHRHTLAEVQGWFRETGLAYVRTYPNAVIAAEPLEGAGLFAVAEDDWGPENLLSQIGWAGTLAREGGLWMTIGRKRSLDPLPRTVAEAKPYPVARF